MPLPMTTSKALSRSLVTISSESPRSNMSRTLPLDRGFSPGSTALSRTLSAMSDSSSGRRDQFGQLPRMPGDGRDRDLVAGAGKRLDGGGMHGVASSRLERESRGGRRRAQDPLPSEQRLRGRHRPGVRGHDEPKELEPAPLGGKAAERHLRIAPARGRVE